MLRFEHTLRWAIAVVAFCFVSLSPLQAARAQALERPVLDRAGVLSPGVVASLESELSAHHAHHGAQIAVLVVKSTDGVPIEDYAHRTATEWALGKQGADDGVLFVLAVSDRRSRLEVGYGLESILTDAIAKQILDSATPSLRAGDYDAAVVTVVSGVLTRLGGSAVALPKPISAPATPPAAPPPALQYTPDEPSEPAWKRLLDRIGLGLLFPYLGWMVYRMLTQKARTGGGQSVDHAGHSSSTSDSWSSSYTSDSSSSSYTSDSSSSSSDYHGGGGSFGGGGASSSW